MPGLLSKLQGKRTHLFVLAAIVLYLFGIIDTPEGIDFSQIDTKDLSNTMLMGAISTAKLGIERALAK
jgi:hypothetical protein